ncbi:hypothetical protein [Bartonella massiliensis]|uniref:hypothetical protein n=1 Tax=Bartonella massiliensis TaxID=929795 RepID=UPI001FE8D2B4|nr:hypothetical protein [Bartonella massiliensis]
MCAGWEAAASRTLEDENPVGKQIELLKTAFRCFERIFPWAFVYLLHLRGIHIFRLGYVAVVYAF